MVDVPNGFEFEVVGGEVRISHHGRRATTLRGPAARQFLVDVELDDPQELMARRTGNYKHGNERTAQEPSAQPGALTCKALGGACCSGGLAGL